MARALKSCILQYQLIYSVRIQRITIVISRGLLIVTMVRQRTGGPSNFISWIIHTIY